MIARLIAALCVGYLLAGVLALDAAGQRGHIPPGLADKLLKGSNAGINVHYLSYQSFTPDTLAFPLNRSFPRYNGNSAAFELAIYIQRNTASHRFYGLVSLPAYLAGLDSLGNSLILDTYGSYFQQLSAGYQFSLPLLLRRSIQLYYGATLSIRHQQTSLTFLPAGKFGKKEFMAGLGPGLSAEVRLLPRLLFRAESAVLFYTPYTSAGVLTTVSESTYMPGQNYRPATYVVASGAHINYDLGEHWQARLGYTRFYAQGLGGVEPAFVPARPVTFSHELTQGIYAGMVYVIPPRWTKRKVEYPCPLSR